MATFTQRQLEAVGAWRAIPHWRDEGLPRTFAAGGESYVTHTIIDEWRNHTAEIAAWKAQGAWRAQEAMFEAIRQALLGEMPDAELSTHGVASPNGPKAAAWYILRDAVDQADWTYIEQVLLAGMPRLPRPHDDSGADEYNDGRFDDPRANGAWTDDDGYHEGADL